jgi:uncharacterized protein (DUF433 family)
MVARIISRGRGPEVEGTRVTVYRIMDFVREDSAADRIANELHLTAEQVRVALDYIAVHRSDVEAEYDQILQRVQQQVGAVLITGNRASRGIDVCREMLKRRSFSRPPLQAKGRFKKKLLVNRAVVKQPLDFGKAQRTPCDCEDGCCAAG